MFFFFRYFAQKKHDELPQIESSQNILKVGANKLPATIWGEISTQYVSLRKKKLTDEGLWNQMLEYVARRC